MKALTTEVKTHVIITHAGGHYFITSQQNDNLELIGLGEFFEVEGNKIKGSSIAEVMTVDQYYNTYPNKRPAPKFEDGFKKYENLSTGVIDRSGVKELQDLMRGVKRAIDEFGDEGVIPHKAIELYERMEKKLKKLEYEGTRK